MGMFDYINTPDIKCPDCEHLVTGFQSKDGECSCTTLEFWEVDNFYSNCDNCGRHLEFNLNPNMRMKPLAHYDLT